MAIARFTGFTYHRSMLSMETVWEGLRMVLPHIALVVATLLYLFVGALIFTAIEAPFERRVRDDHTRRIRQAQDDLLASNDTETALACISRLEEALFAAWEVGLRPSDVSEHSHFYSRWNLPSALFFTTTVLTSIGYGHLIPISPIGQLFCMCYAILGIPLTLVTIADLAKFLADSLGTGENPLDDIPSSRKVVVVILLFGYMTVAAGIFTQYEQSWSFLDSFYFCLISLLTVGFGDLYPAGEVEYLLISILFLFLGLVLTSLAVDVLGSSCIARLHALGGGFDARTLLGALRGRNAGEKSGGDSWFAYMPADLSAIPFIDSSEIPNNSTSNTLQD